MLQRLYAAHSVKNILINGLPSLCQKFNFCSCWIIFLYIWVLRIYLITRKSISTGISSKFVTSGIVASLVAAIGPCFNSHESK